MFKFFNQRYASDILRYIPRFRCYLVLLLSVNENAEEGRATLVQHIHAPNSSGHLLIRYLLVTLPYPTIFTSKPLFRNMNKLSLMTFHLYLYRLKILLLL